MSRRHPLTEANACVGCKHYAEGQVFELCHHEQSRYVVADKTDVHTIGHMRSDRGPCGAEGRLYSK